MLTGTLDASGGTGGAIALTAARVLNQGRILADGTTGAGGALAISAGHSYIDTTAARWSANGGTKGGTLTIDTPAAESRIYSSSTMDVSASAGIGGSITLTSQEVYLMESQLLANGLSGGGQILVGGDYRGGNSAIRNAETVYVSGGVQLSASAGTVENGGKIVVWSNGSTDFYGTLTARGGSVSGNGGIMEVSGKERLTFGGFADAGAVNGLAGSLLLDPKNLIIAEGGSTGTTLFELVDPDKAAGNAFGANTVALSTGNVVITSSGDDGAATNTGAAYLFNGATGALISSVVGSEANDNVGSSGVVALSNGNYVVSSSRWNGYRGAVMFGSGTAGISGTITAANANLQALVVDTVNGTYFSRFISDTSGGAGGCMPVRSTASRSFSSLNRIPLQMSPSPRPRSPRSRTPVRRLFCRPTTI